MMYTCIYDVYMMYDDPQFFFQLETSAMVVELQGQWGGSCGHLYHHRLVAAFLLAWKWKTKSPGR